ncbi:MAG: fused DSP-PTPase phosphatase/NAD kinase-like protein [Blastocatellia bacterium]
MIKNYSPEGFNQVFSPVTKIFARKFWLSFVAFSMILSLGAVSFASSDRKGDKFTSNSGSNEVVVEVENFGKVTDFYYRGAQPKGEEYGQLAAVGVKTVIDLRDDPKDYARTLAEQAGMKYINMPMSDKSYPAPDVASKFLALVNDKENWPVYVHCAGGRHRTGAMTAVFRMTMQGWDVERAYEEMKDYDFYTRWGHKDMKRFVFNYYRELNNRQAKQTADSIK